MLATFLSPLMAIVCLASKPDMPRIVTAVVLIEYFVQQLESFVSRDMFFIFSPSVRSPDHHVVVRTRHPQKWRRLSLGAEIKTRLRDLGDLDTAPRKPEENLDQVFHTSNLHRSLRHLPGGLLLIHPLLCTRSVLWCCSC